MWSNLTNFSFIDAWFFIERNISFVALPDTASSATLACCFTSSSLALIFRSAADNLSDRVLTPSPTSSSATATFDVTSCDWLLCVGYAYGNKPRNTNVHPSPYYVKAKSILQSISGNEREVWQVGRIREIKISKLSIVSHLIIEHDLHGKFLVKCLEFLIM